MKRQLLLFVTMLLATIMPMKLWAADGNPEPYAVLTGDTLLTFFYDDQMSLRGGMSVRPFAAYDDVPWFNQRESITSVEFDPSFANCTSITSTANWFYGCKNMVSISGIEYLNTANVTDMESMFAECSSLTTLDLSHFNTEKVHSMFNMFNGCSSLTNLDLSGFNTTNVNSMCQMFYGCSSLTSLDLSHFNTANVTYMGIMFYGCSSLTSLDVSRFNTANVEDMGAMFSGCSGLTNLDVSHFNMDKVDNMQEMFFGCSGLTSLDITGFHPIDGAQMSDMFTGCSGLKTIYASSAWTTDAVKTGYRYNMFTGCTSLVGGAGTPYDANHVDVSYAHIDGGTSNPGYFTEYNERVINGKFVTTDYSSFAYALEDNGTVIEITDNDIVEDSENPGNRCVKIVSKDNATENWDSHFIIRIGEPLKEGQTYKFSMRAKANKNVSISSQARTTPDQYLHYRMLGNLDLTTEWNTYNVEGVVESEQAGCTIIALLLNVDKSSAEYYFDDISFRVNEFPVTSPEPYAVLSENNTKLTFFYDDQKAIRGGMSVGPFVDYNDVSWNNQRGSITTVEFDSSFANCTTLTSTAYWFDRCQNMVSISGIEYLKTDSVTNMACMFSGCYGLTSLDLSHFNTENVTNMGGMFSNCYNLTSLDVSGFNTANVTDMSFMFSDCSGLTSLEVAHFKTDNVTGMNYMFRGCSGLTSLDLSGFNTANVTNMASMFRGCSGLTSLDVSRFNTANVTYMADMFSSCSSLTSIDVSHFNTANVTTMSCMFIKCSGLTSLDVSNFNTEKVWDMSSMFDGCSSLTSLDVSHFNTEKVTSMFSLFSGCSGLTNLDLSHFNTANVINMDYMFAGCTSLTILDISAFNTEKVTDVYEMFRGCTGLKTIYAGSGWTTNAVTVGNGMFTGCTSLEGGAGTPYNANHVDYTYAHIDGGENNPGYLTWKGEGMTVNKLYIIGSGTAGEWNATTEMPFNDATKAFEYTIENTSTAWITFGIQPLNGDWGVFNNNYRYAIGNGNVVPVIGQEYQLVPSPETGCVMIEEQGKYFISVTKDLRMTIIKDGDEHPGTNIYVESEQAPYLYAFDANDQALNGEFPGNQMTKTVTIDGKQFWTTKISSTDPFNINIIDGNQYRTREIYVISDRYFTYLGLSSYRDVTEQYANAPEIQISSIALTGNHNEWGRNDLFTEVEPGKQYTMDVDLTNVTLEDDVMQFKLYANACAWLGITSLTLEAPSYVHSVGDPALGTSSRNFYMDLNEAPTRHFKFDAVWRGDTQMEEGWTLTITEVNPAEAEPYAVLSENNTKLTFFYDEKKAMRGGMSVGPFLSYSERGWHDQRESITNVVFDTSFAECTTLTSTAHWFYGCENLTTITDISNLRTDNVTRMRYMFRYCSKLTSLDVSGFKTDNVTDMLAMFSHCSSLTSLDVSGFNTENVTDMKDMFDGCSKLTTIDVSRFNTAKVTNMSVMFQLCTSLTSLDLSNFNTSNVTNTQGMFYGCSNLVNLDIRNFDMSKVNNEEKNMFVGCSSLASIIAGNANILAEEYANIGNPNLLVYVNEAWLAPSNVQNVVINGMAREIVLTDAQDGNNNWYAPLAFVAERISYTRNFEQSTTKGTSRGWESIALPFRVQTVQHETKGVIAPFNNSASNKHFWLRRLGDNGLHAATSIEANTPYVISMPNSEEYTADYNLNGRVTFSAQNVDVPATVTHTLALADSSIVMVPAMQRKERSSSVWALNVGEVRGSYFEGSVFERDYREVRPFEAYTVHRLENGQPAPRYVPLMEIGGTTGIETIDHGPLTIDRWYDLEGRKLQGKPTQKGVYISNGRKVVVK